MSAAGSQGPNALGPQYGGVGGGGGYSVPTPTSTVHDDYTHDVKVSSASGLPPFSSFEMADGVGLGHPIGHPVGHPIGHPGGHTYTQLDHGQSWEYYGEGLTGRLMDRGDMHHLHQPNYRPWESKPLDGGDPNAPPNGAPNGGPPPPGFPGSKLPSFQSQFTFAEQQQQADGTTLIPLAPTAAPASPSSTSGLPSFHTLSTVPVPGVPVGVPGVPRGYPLVPAPVQAREVPAIQQQIMDERHIHVTFGGLPPPGVPPPGVGVPPPGLPHQQLAQFHHPLLPTHPSHHPGHHPGVHPGPTVLTMVKSEPVTIVTSTPPQLTQLHHANFQNPMGVLDKCDENGHHLSKLEDAGLRGLDSRKKERRKVRASSLESSAESDGAGSSSLESSGQVAAVSSTAGSGFKSPLQAGSAPPATQGPGSDDGESSSGEKPVKKKRKRCGECIGCQRKDNCGDCAPCRNEKSHQICKMRRCEKLTEKKGYRNKARQSVGGTQTPQPASQPQTPTPQSGQSGQQQQQQQSQQPQPGQVTPQPVQPVQSVQSGPDQTGAGPMITNVSEQSVSGEKLLPLHHGQHHMQYVVQTGHPGTPIAQQPMSPMSPMGTMGQAVGQPVYHTQPVVESSTGPLFWANWIHQ